MDRLVNDNDHCRSLLFTTVMDDKMGIWFEAVLFSQTIGGGLVLDRVGAHALDIFTTVGIVWNDVDLASLCFCIGFDHRYH